LGKIAVQSGVFVDEGAQEDSLIPQNRGMESQKVLVTGAAGFLGSHLCDALLARGGEVIGIDNLSTGSLANLGHLENEIRFRFERQDICEPFDVGPVDYIFNLASPASPVDYMRLGIETLRVGSAGTFNTLELAKRYKAGYLHASTSECYGDPEVHPQIESYWGNVNPIGPRSVYDEAKRFSEAAVSAYHRYYGVNTHLVRIFNTYGPRLQANDGRVISNLMMQALRGEPLTVYGDGSQTRSFCYVSDLVEGILRLASSEEHEPVNIGNPKEFTILECAAEVQALVGSKCEIVFKPLPKDDPKQRQPDITRARTLLGWEPRVSLREGLLRSLDYFKSAVETEKKEPRRRQAMAEQSEEYFRLASGR
jgi:dTDP-glucose 4,6-dehydratase